MRRILIGIGALVAVVLVYFIASSGKDKSAEILAQVDTLGKRLSSLENRIGGLEKQQEDLARGPVKSLAERVEMLEKRPAEKPKPPAVPKPQAPSAAKRLHQVKKGETLTSIAKRYGLSVEELRRLNHLPPKGELSVGQKLIVSPGGKS